MIDKSICYKLALIPTNLGVKSSFINNCEARIIPAFTLLDSNAYLMDCDFEGEPLPKDRYMFFCPSLDSHIIVTNEFLVNNSNDTLYYFFSKHLAESDINAI